MEINLIIVLFILFWHWFADFVCQTDWMATNKSKNPTALLSHTGVYSGLWVLPVIIGGCIFGYSPLMIWFPVITFIAHTITDFFTSRINSSLWKMGKVHYFFVSVGFDQFLHFAQLFLTYWFLTS